MGELLMEFLIGEGTKPRELWKFYGFETLEDWELFGGAWDDSW